MAISGNQSYSEFEGLFKVWRKPAKQMGLPDLPRRSDFMGDIDLAHKNRSEKGKKRLLD